MNTSLLTTKLYVPPPRAKLVPRSRLVARLDEGLRLGHRLTLISSSAGSGKTTLLSEWAAGSTLQCCWLSLDEEDSEPARFWAHIVAALQTIRPQLGQSALPMLQGSQPPPARTILAPLLNEVAALRDLIVLVLDDYHLVTNEAIHNDVAFLLEHLPRQMHLVIATRADPLLPIARLRARGQLTELRADDLRFTIDETAMFLNDVMELGLRPKDIARLDARTEGWASGLHLAALSMQSHPDAQAFIEAFTGGHQYILEYLVEEVLSRQSDLVQRFLLQTSILDRLCALLCDALADDHNGDSVLEHLQRDNLFVIPLDDEQCWYRYHHLFCDLLRKRLGQTMSAGQIATLHQRASRWYEENDLLELAVKHAQAAGDYERIAEITERSAGDSLLDARLTALLRWVNVLPWDVLRAHPRLQIYRAWALYMNGHLEAAQQALRDCRQVLEVMPALPGNNVTHHALSRLLDIIDMLAQGFMFAIDNRLEEAIRVCSRARDMAMEDGHIFLAAQAIEGLALAQYHQGHLRASAQFCRQMIELAEHSTAQAPLAAAGYVELAGIHIEWNDLETAAGLLDKAQVLCRQWGIIQTLNEAYTAQSHLLQIKGDAKGAWKALEKAHEFNTMEGDHSMVNFRLATQRAHLSLLAGKPGEVVQWIEESSRHNQQWPATFGETLQTMLARAYLAQGKTEEALTVLEQLLPPAESAGASLWVIEICVLSALALYDLGDTAAALASLERSMALAEPESYVRMYLSEGAPMATLLREAALRNIMPGYTGRLLAAFEAESAACSVPLPDDANLLTPRERDILCLISQGLSNQQIADELVIALNTVKRHTSSIYDKLGVKSRTQAIIRARELGLISAGRE